MNRQDLIIDTNQYLSELSQRFAMEAIGLSVMGSPEKHLIKLLEQAADNLKQRAEDLAQIAAEAAKKA